MKNTPKTLIVGLLVFAGMFSQIQAAITNGLVGHWAFDETEGFTAADSSGSGNTGTVNNSYGDSPQWGTGQIGGSLAFRGLGFGDDYVVVPTYPAPSTALSISAWAYSDPREVWPQSTIVENGLSLGGPFGLVIRLKDLDQDFGPLGSTIKDLSNQIVVNENVGFPTAAWQHVGLVVEGSAIRLYRNGAEVAVAANFGGTLAVSSSAALGIGATLDDTGLALDGFWQGKIDDVGIWTQALTAAQMASIFNAGMAGKDLTQADQYENLPPTITDQPDDASRFVGETVTFSVKASGTGTLSYQWKLNGQPIPGATNSTYNIASVKESDAGDYIVVVANPGGSVSSEKAVLTVQKPVSRRVWWVIGSLTKPRVKTLLIRLRIRMQALFTGRLVTILNGLGDKLAVRFNSAAPIPSNMCWSRTFPNQSTLSPFLCGRGPTRVQPGLLL